MPATPSSLNDDLLSAENIADPFPAFAALRATAPVHFSEAHRAWLVSRHDDVVAGFMDARLSSDRVRPLLAGLDEERRRQVGPVMEMIKDWMVVTDPPEHTRLRRLAGRAFNPRRVAASEPRVARLVDELLDRFIAEGHQDLIAHFTFPLPATVIAELIGAPPEDRDLFHGWSNDLAAVAFGAGGEERGDRHERAMRGLQELLDYIDGLVERARAAPGEDMVSGLLEGDGKGDFLSHDEVKSMCALMLFAGHETTTTLVSNAVKTLLDHPGQLALLERDPALAPQVVEEMLRFEGPIKVLIRWVTEDFTWHGQTIRAGERVFLLPASANRDAGRFQDPDRVDVLRKPNPHVAFGKGVHACIGAQLARIESRLAMASIFRRLPNLRLVDDEPEWLPSLASRALRTLRVEHDADGHPSARARG